MRFPRFRSDRARFHILLVFAFIAIVLVLSDPFDEKRLRIAIHQGVEGVALKEPVPFLSFPAQGLDLLACPRELQFASGLRSQRLGLRVAMEHLFT